MAIREDAMVVPTGTLVRTPNDGVVSVADAMVTMPKDATVDTSSNQVVLPADVTVANPNDNMVGAPKNKSVHSFHISDGDVLVYIQEKTPYLTQSGAVDMDDAYEETASSSATTAREPVFSHDLPSQTSDFPINEVHIDATLAIPFIATDTSLTPFSPNSHFDIMASSTLIAANEYHEESPNKHNVTSETIIAANKALWDKTR